MQDLAMLHIDVDLKIMFTKYAYTIESVRKNKLVPDISINKFTLYPRNIYNYNDTGLYVNIIKRIPISKI